MLAAMVWIWFIQSRLTRLWCLSVCDFLSTTPYDIHKLNKKLHGLVFLPTTHFKIVSKQFFSEVNYFCLENELLSGKIEFSSLSSNFRFWSWSTSWSGHGGSGNEKKSQLYPSTFKVYPHFTPGGFFCRASTYILQQMCG